MEETVSVVSLKISQVGVRGGSEVSNGIRGLPLEAVYASVAVCLW